MSDLYFEWAYRFWILEWIFAIAINVFIVYLCWKFLMFGLSGDLKRFFTFKKKKKSDVNSGAKFG